MSSPQGELIDQAYKGGKAGAEFIDRCRRTNVHPDALHELVADLTNAGDVAGLRACLRTIQKALGG